MEASSAKPKRYSMDNVSLFARFVRWALRWIARFLTTFFTRTTIIGRENIPTEGPAIFAANHSSIFDAILYFAYLPSRTQYVGPGDFRLKYPNRIAAEWTDVILVKRGAPDTVSLRAMIDTLKAGNFIGLFPEGGTWEKRLYDVKDGAAYLSMVGQAPIIPIAFSNTYDLWGQIFSFKRPKIVIQFLPAMPPVEKGTKKNRKEILSQASYDVMRRIYEALTEEELERYKLHTRQQFTGYFELQNAKEDYFADAHNYEILAELVTKKNLFSTFHEHLKIPVYPLMELESFHSLLAIRIAVDSLHDALVHDVPDYIDYRLPAGSHLKILAELKEIQKTLKLIDDKQVRLRFVAEVDDNNDTIITLEPPSAADAQVGTM